MVKTGSHFSSSFGEYVELAFGISPEIYERDQEPTNEEKCVHAVLSVHDCLKQEELFHAFLKLRILAVFKSDYGQVAKDNPAHGNSS